MKEHANGKIEITRICGPVAKVNDTTFTVRFYRMGMDNPSVPVIFGCWLLMRGMENIKSGATTQYPHPYRNTEGKRQYILFPGIGRCKGGSEVCIFRGCF